MSLFKKEQMEEFVPEAPSASNPRQKKGPTPSRKSQEAKNFQGLLGVDKKVAKARAREESQRRFAREQEGMRTGREDLLPPHHQGPARRFVRDFIDSRYTFVEWMVVVVLVLMLGSSALVLLLSSKNPTLSGQINVACLVLSYVALIGGGVEAGVLAGVARRKAIKTLGAEKVPRGLRWYAFSRMMMPRRWRQPRPQVTRGGKARKR